MAALATGLGCQFRCVKNPQDSKPALVMVYLTNTEVITYDAQNAFVKEVKLNSNNIDLLRKAETEFRSASAHEFYDRGVEGNSDWQEAEVEASGANEVKKFISTTDKVGGLTNLLITRNEIAKHGSMWESTNGTSGRNRSYPHNADYACVIYKGLYYLDGALGFSEAQKSDKAHIDWITNSKRQEDSLLASWRCPSD